MRESLLSRKFREQKYVFLILYLVAITICFLFFFDAKWIQLVSANFYISWFLLDVVGVDRCCNIYNNLMFTLVNGGSLSLTTFSQQGSA